MSSSRVVICILLLILIVFTVRLFRVRFFSTILLLTLTGSTFVLVCLFFSVLLLVLVILLHFLLVPSLVIGMELVIISCPATVIIISVWVSPSLLLVFTKRSICVRTRITCTRIRSLSSCTILPRIDVIASYIVIALSFLIRKYLISFWNLFKLFFCLLVISFLSIGMIFLCQSIKLFLNFILLSSIFNVQNFVIVYLSIKFFTSWKTS